MEKLTRRNAYIQHHKHVLEFHSAVCEISNTSITSPRQQWEIKCTEISWFSDVSLRKTRPVNEREQLSEDRSAGTLQNDSKRLWCKVDPLECGLEWIKFTSRRHWLEKQLKTQTHTLSPDKSAHPLRGDGSSNTRLYLSE